MIKSLVILFNTLSVFLFSFFFGDSPVAIVGNFPKSIKANTEFTADVVIKKGTIGGFAKLQLEVPEGFVVKELDSKTGNFSFTNNIVKIIWTSVPNDAEFTVKFMLTAEAPLTGLKTITSKFSYVNNNNKESVEMTPAEILIGDEATPVVENTQNSEEQTVLAVETKTETPISSQSNANNSETKSLDNPVEPNSFISCNRIISKTPNQNEILVNVKIKKGNTRGFAKFQEILPMGCTAKQGDTNGSSFSVSDGKIKFVWVSLQTEEELSISYTLETTASTPSDASLSGGEFSYLENDQTKKCKLPNELLNQSSSNSAASNTSSESSNKTIVPQNKNSNEPNNNTPTENTAAVSNVKTTNGNVIAKKEGNVSYLVQIGAFKAAVTSEVMATKFKLTEPIKSEMSEGYTKFMIGNFNEYKQARAQRDQVKQKGCSTAFVTAYNGAKRITVQEGLMITSQKWFK